VRLNAAILPTSWIRFAVQFQDSRAAGRRVPVPAAVENPFDIHNAFVELGKPGNDGWSLRVGRQELAYGDERLVGPANWGNVGRVFDAARVAYQRKKIRLEGFASALVINDEDRFDPFELDQQLFGLYVSFATLGERKSIQVECVSMGASPINSTTPGRSPCKAVTWPATHCEPGPVR
jgi:hypothetical protein